jgi:hypothetical protein
MGVGAAIAIAAVVGAAGSYMSAKKSAKGSKTKTDIYDTLSFSNPVWNAFYNLGGATDKYSEDGTYQFLQEEAVKNIAEIAAGIEDDDIRMSMLSAVSSSYANVKDANARAGSVLGGVNALNPAVLAASQGKATTSTLGEFAKIKAMLAQTSIQAQESMDRNWNSWQNIRIGQPASSSTTSAVDYGAAIGGGLAGAGQGAQLATSYYNAQAAQAAAATPAPAA